MTSRGESQHPGGHYTELFDDAGPAMEAEDPDYEDDEIEDDEADFEEEDEFHDAETGDEDMENEIPSDEQYEDEPEDEAAETANIVRQLFASHHVGATGPGNFLSVLRGTDLRRLLLGGGDDEELDNPYSRPRRNLDPDRFPKVPSAEGQELMRSGLFGATDLRAPLGSRKRIARRILDRELGIGDATHRRINHKAMAQNMLPSTPAEMIINYHDPVYSGQFSDDGNFFFACVKDFKVRMYDTSNPYNWRHYKTVLFPGGSWTLTDASLSPDNRWLAYTSIDSNVCLAPTDPNDVGDPYIFNLDSTPRLNHPLIRQRGFGIWSIRFSGDGRELVAGTNNRSIIVYDIESRQVLHKVWGHADDVNAVCFADKSSPHILYSGSDDATIKVWDRRSMGDSREAGAFVGHIQGLTYIDSKGDGRYILSNSKDQSMKLWDLKMMYTTAQFEDLPPVPRRPFDYRWDHYHPDDWHPHPHDNSLVTFRGHSVHRTLIRCHFSPPGSTDSRYVYTGSHDGNVYVYNMDATIAAKIDVRSASMPRQALPRRLRRHQGRHYQAAWKTCVRDASWHPNAPFIAASSLNGWDQAQGTVTLHSYNESSEDEGEPRMGQGYSDKLVPIANANEESGASDEEEEEEVDEDEDGVWGFVPYDD